MWEGKSISLLPTLTKENDNSFISFFSTIITIALKNNSSKMYFFLSHSLSQTDQVHSLLNTHLYLPNYVLLYNSQPPHLFNKIELSLILFQFYHTRTQNIISLSPLKTILMRNTLSTQHREFLWKNHYNLNHL